jgi:hypothetical protein
VIGDARKRDVRKVSTPDFVEHFFEVKFVAERLFEVFFCSKFDRQKSIVFVGVGDAVDVTFVIVVVAVVDVEMFGQRFFVQIEFAPNFLQNSSLS